LSISGRIGDPNGAHDINATDKFEDLLTEPDVARETSWQCNHVTAALLRRRASNAEAKGQYFPWDDVKNQTERRRGIAANFNCRPSHEVPET
jgi:hypothetical protein